MAPCHLAKQKDPDTHSNWSPQEANSVPILPQSASRHEAGGRNPHSNHLCRSTVRFGSKNRLQRSRKRGPRDAGALRVSFSLILGLVKGCLPIAVDKLLQFFLFLRDSYPSFSTATREDVEFYIEKLELLKELV